MTQTVAVPLWLFLLIVLFAAVTFASHFLFPSVRWFFRRRAERLVAELNRHLERPIQPFKLLRRQDTIQHVVYDPEVVRAAGEYAAANALREDVAFEKARDYAREIVPAFSAFAYFKFAIRVSRWLATTLFDVRIHRVDEAALASIDPDATVVFVMNHRSNFDYVLVTYLAAPQSALSYAVGEWARVWPLSWLIRSMGAYFIRRRSRDALYRKVLATYVKKATQAGVTQAVFPEGGLSRDGKLGRPKLGILSYIVQGWREDGRDVVFVPVALNYDRVVEDRILVAAGRSGRRRFRASAPEAVRFTFRYIRRRLAGRVGRFGVAAVTFGRPVALSGLAAANSGDLVEHLAGRLASEIRGATPVVTVPLILAALLVNGGSGTVAGIAATKARLRGALPAGAPVFALAPDDTEGLRRELDILVLRRVLAREGETYRILDTHLAAYYANSLSPHLSADAAAAIPDIGQAHESVKS